MGFVTKDDLELALSHGLMQHEKMIAATRTVVSSLNQAQEALGRRLDELYMFHLEVSPMLPELESPEEEYDLILFAEQVVHWSQTVYTELADELYRKQTIVHTLANSVTDGLLYKESDEDSYDDEKNPRKVASKCLQAWPRGGSEEKSKDLANLLAATPWNEVN